MKVARKNKNVFGGGHASYALSSLPTITHFSTKNFNNMKIYKKAVVKVSDIKTKYYQPENSKEFLFTLGVLLKTILPLEVVVVHKGTMQLIANGHYLQLAIEEGKGEIEVILADFPEDHLLHAIATHWKPTKKYAV